jgi:hypothetical protein
MHPRFESRVAFVAQERREVLMGQLDYAAEQLSRLSGYSVIEPLVLGCQSLKAELTVATLSGQEIRTLEENLSADMRCIVHEILLPLLDIMRATGNAPPLPETSRPEAAVARPSSCCPAAPPLPRHW